MEIALEPSLGPAELLPHLREFFGDPGVQALRDLADAPGSGVLVQVTELEPGGRYRTGLDVLGPDPGEVLPVLIALARRLSEVFDCRTFTEAGPLAPSDAPYWSVLFDRGRPFLAWDAAYDETGDVEIERELDPGDVPAWTPRRVS